MIVACVAQWLTHLICNEKIPGSTPGISFSHVRPQLDIGPRMCLNKALLSTHFYSIFDEAYPTRHACRKLTVLN